MNNRLREVRMMIGMSVSELAHRTNTSRQTITNIELHGQEPSGFVMLEIANALLGCLYIILLILIKK